MSILDEITEEKRRLSEMLARLDEEREQLSRQLGELEAARRPTQVAEPNGGAPDLKLLEERADQRIAEARRLVEQAERVGPQPPSLWEESQAGSDRMFAESVQELQGTIGLFGRFTRLAGGINGAWAAINFYLESSAAANRAALAGARDLIRCQAEIVDQTLAEVFDRIEALIREETPPTVARLIEALAPVLNNAVARLSELTNMFRKPQTADLLNDRFSNVINELLAPVMASEDGRPAR
jgi:hypothetical protein